MLRKYVLIASVLAVFGMPLKAQAQTMDIAMKIQAILDQFSEIRSGLKQIQSSMNIETMLQNLAGGGDWKAMLKNAVGGLAGGIFNSKSSDNGGSKQAVLVVPEGLENKADDPQAAADWIEKNMLEQVENPTMEDLDNLEKKKKDFKYTALITGYGKAVSVRKQLDKAAESIEQLKQDAEGKDAETDLQNEINKLVLLKLEQTNFQQLISASESQAFGASNLLTAKTSGKNDKK